MNIDCLSTDNSLYNLRYISSCKFIAMNLAYVVMAVATECIHNFLSDTIDIQYLHYPRIHSYKIVIPRFFHKCAWLGKESVCESL